MQRVIDLPLTLNNTETISLASNNPCISNPPIVCYQVAYYNFTVTLPPSAEGYIIASQINYRIAGISNLDQSFGFTGATYTAEIPGTDDAPDAMANHSANFTGSDLVIVCADNSMEYSFAAMDADGDQLVYTFCNAYNSASSGQNNGPIPNPPYDPVPYGSGFSGGSPLGDYIHINNSNGLITGIAPGAGQYVVTVCVSEIRNGKVIAVQRKDLQINIAPCSIAAATLLPVYMLCKDTKTMTFANNSTSTLINTYNWDVVDKNNNVLFSSAAVNPTYTFPDTGTYKIKLAINRGQQCSDSTTSIVRVYPGFFPAFSFAGVCLGKPTKFTDLTTSVFGTVNSWTWDLGELSAVSDDNSTLQHPAYTYPSGGTKNVTLIATDTKGCKDTVQKLISIIDKPPLNLLFSDTLICKPDSVKLIAAASGIFTWSPSTNMINGNTATPTVAPNVTTKYYVDIDDNDCKNRDSVIVRVTDRVNLTAMNDTLICKGDTIQLRTISDAFRFVWTPAVQVLKQESNPFVATPVKTTYSVTGYIGSCFTKKSIVVNVAPYPTANAGADTILCFGTPAFLHATSDGNKFSWTPTSSLSNASILDPIANPVSTTTYTISAFDSKGCPKPGFDEVVIKVLPKIHASAGRDTVVVIG
ncbi:MAG TPA: PKD domain-containing protein, partial [Chitinophagaceae bacterium]|nr:PKD domain-containing protein [Chitinophagaceae bacterium]